MRTRRPARRAAALAAAALVVSCGGGPDGGAPAGAGAEGTEQAVSEPAERVARTAHYDLYSDLDVNLHHFLYQWSRHERPLDRWDRVEVAEREDVTGLPPEERTAWDEAVAVYRRELANRDLLFTAGMEQLRDVVAGLRATGYGEEPALVVETLDRVRPIYRERWWPRHDAANRAWVEELLPALVEHEEEIAARLAAAYGGVFPAPPIRVDVTYYANHLGAYTSAKPHVTVSSSDSSYRMPRALEMIFHETSHADALTLPLLVSLDRHFGYHDRRPPWWFSHLMIFHTAGEVTRLVLEEAGERGYRHYGRDGLYTVNPDRARQTEVLDRHWRPFLAGETSRDDALAAIAAELASDAD
ncbi:MAG: hypothetical protein R3325_14725 [Thermoanaerobaculia bacterium]|nr:hypothetical protein [Thermoanaerobaculia bacterium]